MWHKHGPKKQENKRKEGKKEEKRKEGRKEREEKKKEGASCSQGNTGKGRGAKSLGRGGQSPELRTPAPWLGALAANPLSGPLPTMCLDRHEQRDIRGCRNYVSVRPVTNDQALPETMSGKSQDFESPCPVPPAAACEAGSKSVQ